MKAKAKTFTGATTECFSFKLSPRTVKGRGGEKRGEIFLAVTFEGEAKEAPLLGILPKRWKEKGRGGKPFHLKNLSKIRGGEKKGTFSGARPSYYSLTL